MRIAVDVMASDLGPAVITRGALQSLAAHADHTLVLVGDGAVIRAEIAAAKADAGRCEVVDAPEFIGMHEHPIEAMRKKPEASLLKAIGLVKDGKADAIISAGSTGAQVAASTIMLGLLPGVKRAGICTLLPHRTGLLAAIDVGANLNCKPVHLFQYGVMGSLFARSTMGIEAPRVGLLSIGSEESKGNPLVIEANALLRGAGLNFTGNTEGHEIFAGKVDVLVCEGFVGNVVLKIAEGMAYVMFGLFGDAAKATGLVTDERFVQTVSAMKKRVDWQETGGAQLLGCNGVSIIAHGRSTERAIASATSLAHKLVATKLNQHIVAALAQNQGAAQA